MLASNNNMRRQVFVNIYAEFNFLVNCSAIASELQKDASLLKEQVALDQSS